MRLEEAFGQLKVHELRLQERNSRNEEQTLLSRDFNKFNKDQRGSSSRRRVVIQILMPNYLVILSLFNFELIKTFIISYLV